MNALQQEIQEAIQPLITEVIELRKQIGKMNPNPEWLSVKDYADSVGKTPSTINRWIRTGKIKTEIRGGVRGVLLK